MELGYRCQMKHSRSTFKAPRMVSKPEFKFKGSYWLARTPYKRMEASTVYRLTQQWKLAFHATSIPQIQVSGYVPRSWKRKKLKYSLVLQFIVEPSFGCLKSSGSDSGSVCVSRGHAQHLSSYQILFCGLRSFSARG
jgi:hypothetical protein